MRPRRAAADADAAGRGRRVPVYVIMVALSYPLLERVRLIATRNQADILGEEFATDITMTLQIPIESFESFQDELRELSAGKIKAEVIESAEKVVAIR